MQHRVRSASNCWKAATESRSQRMGAYDELISPQEKGPAEKQAEWVKLKARC